MPSKSAGSKKRSRRVESVLKVFVIKGHRRIQDVGARPKLYELANKNGVHVFPRNVPGNKIEIIVKGDQASIKRFWKCVKTTDLVQMKGNPKSIAPYEVGRLGDYVGDEPDFGYFASSLTMEQVSKGTKYLVSIDSKLNKLDKLDELGKLNKLDKLDKLDKLPKEIAKAIRKSKKS
jgi:acylphosphatase